MTINRHIQREAERLVAKYGKLIRFLCLRASYGQDVYYCDLLQECYLMLINRLEERKPGMSELQEHAWVYWCCRDAIALPQPRKAFPLGVARRVAARHKGSSQRGDTKHHRRPGLLPQGDGAPLFPPHGQWPLRRGDRKGIRNLPSPPPPASPHDKEKTRAIY